MSLNGIAAPNQGAQGGIRYSTMGAMPVGSQPPMSPHQVPVSPHPHSPAQVPLAPQLRAQAQSTNLYTQTGQPVVNYIQSPGGFPPNWQGGVGAGGPGMNPVHLSAQVRKNNLFKS